VDMFIHDTYFIVAHLHYVLFGGSLFGVFAAINYWYPKMFGRMMTRRSTPGFTPSCRCVLQPDLLPDAHPGDGRAHAAQSTNPTLYRVLKPMQPMNQVHQRHAFLLGRRRSCSHPTSSTACSPAGGPIESVGTRTRWSGRPLSRTSPQLGGEGSTVYRGPYEYSSARGDRGLPAADRALGVPAPQGRPRRRPGA